MDVESSTSEKDFTEYPTVVRRYTLLAIFALTIYIDVLGASAFFVFTGTVSADLGIPFAQQSWVITAYAVTFASFLVFWGKAAELLGPKTVFCPAFMVAGIINLVLSFVTDRYAFFVLRGLNGVAAAAVVPTAYRLIAITFPIEQRGRAYTLYTMTGSIANVTGTIFAGVVALIPRNMGTQMVEWRWFFRIVAVIAVGGAIVSYVFIPNDAKHDGINRQTLKRLDIPGLVTLQCAIILFITGLTLGASYGWTKATFLVPFLISLVLFPLFFLRESKVKFEYALIPSSLWRLPNVPALIALSLITLGWWNVLFLPFIELFHFVHGEPIILAACRTLPLGISAGIISVILVVFPSLVRHPKWPIIISLTLCSVAFVLFTQTPSVVGVHYWSYVFPGMFIGSAGMQLVLLATNVGIVLSAPPEKAGLIAAVYQTSMQVSTVIALSIQAGLMTIYPGGIYEWKNVRASWYFELGWTVLWLIGFMTLYRSSKESHRTAKVAAQDIRLGVEEQLPVPGLSGAPTAVDLSLTMTKEESVETK